MRSKFLGAAAGEALLAAAPGLAHRQTADDQPRQDIVVTGTPYRGEVSSGGARIDAAVKDLPLSISVLTRAVIEDRQLRNIRELADNVAGVQGRSSGEQAFETDFTVRGVTGYGGGVALNGFRVYAYAVGRDPATVERVEFLKGPASVLYGASGALSGLVNIVTFSFRRSTPFRATVGARIRL